VLRDKITVVDLKVDSAKIKVPKDMGNMIKHTKKILVRLRVMLPSFDFKVTLDVPAICCFLSLCRARKQNLLVQQCYLSNKEDSIYGGVLE
jgi:hypothetical protein